MSSITNFNPIKAINSLLHPLGLTLSNKQQIINKAALAALAILVVASEFAMVEAQSSTIRDAGRAQNAQDCYRTCGYLWLPCYDSDPNLNACLENQRGVNALRARCNAFCRRRWGT